MSVSEQKDRQRKRLRRRGHIRKRIFGLAEKPRMSVFRSNRHLYVQVIDDVGGTTIASASSLETSFKDLKHNQDTATKLGEEIGKRLLAKEVKSVVFDRNGYKYHGLLRALADGARKSGVTL